MSREHGDFDKQKDAVAGAAPLDSDRSAQTGARARPSQPGEGGSRSEDRGYKEGDLIGERYRVIARLGSGGMGVVYKVEQIYVHKHMALKTLAAKDVSEANIRRLHQEGKAAFALDHPNLVTVTDFQTLADGSPFLVMEFVEGQTLAEHLIANGPLPYDQACLMFAQVCLGLAHAHQKGIVHRDIKPSNIMLTGVPLDEPGCVKILDFGIAKFLQQEGGAMQALTRTGEIFGSPLYMSPEQCVGDKVDHRSDIYSVACVLFESLTGGAPFIADTAFATLNKHQNEKPMTLEEASLGKKFPPALEELVQRMLAKSPDDRPQNIGLTAIALAEIEREKGVATDAAPAARTGVKQANKAAGTVTLSKPVFYVLLVAPLVSVLVAVLVASHLQPKASLPDGRATRDLEPTLWLKGEQETGTASPSTRTRVAEIASDPKAFDFSDTELSPKQGGTFEFTGHEVLSARNFRQIAAQNWIADLKLEGTRFESTDLKYLIGMKSLLRLHLASTSYDDSGAPILAKMPALIYLSMEDTSMTDTTLKYIGGLKHLQEIKVCHISDYGARLLSQSGRLSCLEIYDSPALSDSGLELLCKLPLKTLRLAECSELSGKGVLALSRITSLNDLELRQINISEQDIVKLLEKSPAITSMKIQSCAQIDEQAFLRLQTRFAKSVKIHTGSTSWQKVLAP